jgi:alpha-galactosidase
MRRQSLIPIMMVVASLAASAAWAPQAPKAKMRQEGANSAIVWGRLLEGQTDPPSWAWSFLYDSRKSSELLPQWKHASKRQPPDAGQTKRAETWSDPRTGLEVRLESVLFPDHAAVESVLYFKNAGKEDTPILEQVWPLDHFVLDPSARAQTQKLVLHYAKGALCCLDDFAPVERPFEAGTEVHLQPGGGRSSSEVLPLFNLDAGDGSGMILGIGWTGEWSATFGRDKENRVFMRAGMATTRLRLRPGEEIRTPRILVLFWQGDRMRGQNLLRRFLLKHHRPQPGAKPLVLPVLVGSWGGSPAADHLKTIERIRRHNLPISLYWIDAEWFGGAPWFRHPGDWEVRKELYPLGFRALSDPLHASGRSLLLWFEPQRVCPGTPWAKFKDRPNWLLELQRGEPAYKQRNMNWGVPHEDPRWILWESRRSQIVEGDMLWNMGEPAARQFLTDWLSERIKQFGLDWYREDFNVAPLEYWQGADPPDRRGITEIRYVTGLYTMWDELLRRHPHLAIDNCASGGRRIDLETIGRATALWRTDWPADAVHRQCHTFGLMPWVPLHMSEGVELRKGNEYEIRSAMTAGLNVKLPPQDDEKSMREAKALIDQYLSIQKYYYGDYYPLTPYSQAPDAWIAYQLDLPESGEGLVVALKRPKSMVKGQRLRLFGLDGAATYEVTNLDSSQSRKIAGSVLTGQGLELVLTGQPDSALVRYARK